jgi:hypothetical protein
VTPYSSPQGEVLLVDLVQANTDQLYRSLVPYPEYSLRLFEHGVPSPGAFQDLLWQGVIAQYLAIVDGAPGALCAVYKADLRSAWAMVEVAPLVSLHGHEAAWNFRDRGAWAIVSYAFNTFPLRKLCAAHADIHPGPFSRFSGFRVDGRLSGDILHEGSYIDRVLTSLTRESWVAE